MVGLTLAAYRWTYASVRLEPKAASPNTPHHVARSFAKAFLKRSSLRSCVRSSPPLIHRVLVWRACVVRRDVMRKRAAPKGR